MKVFFILCYVFLMPIFSNFFRNIFSIICAGQDSEVYSTEHNHFYTDYCPDVDRGQVILLLQTSHKERVEES